MKKKASLFLLGISFYFFPLVSSSQNLQVLTGSQGIEGLSYNGTSLLNTHLQQGSALTTEGFIQKDKQGTLKPGWSQMLHNQFDPTSGFYLGVFNWGTLRYRYRAVKDTLKITLKLTNTSPTDTLCGVNIYPLHLSFPQRPVGFQPLNFYFNYNLDAPTVIPVNYGSGKMVVCNDEVNNTVFVGLVDKNEAQGGAYKLWVSNIGFNGFPELAPIIYKKLAPGKSVTYNISLRFCSPTADEYLLAQDIFTRYRQKWAPKISWKDRRPIGTLVLSSVENKADTNNPRGWLPNNVVNVNSRQGRQEFANKILGYADQSIAILKEANAQGMITWDIEGQEFPHPLSYIGSPEEVDRIAPEMTNVADLYFKKFRDAGFKVGVCIRPDSVALSSDKKVLARFEKNQFNHLRKKIAYARKRWGCTLFYVDSNGDPNYPMTADVFKRLNALFPNVLLIPEHQNSRYYAYTAPYEEMRSGISLLPQLTRMTYPNSFMVLNVAEGLPPGGDSTSSSEKLKESIKQGNILLFRAWYQDQPTNGLVREAYKTVNEN